MTAIVNVQLQFFPEEFRLENRKYIGSKQRLLTFIEKHICSLVGQFDSLADIFAGTGAVAQHFAQCGKIVHTNDHLFSNYIGLYTFLADTPERHNSERIQQLLTYLNQLPPKRGYCADNYGNTYFTVDNAAKIDAVRDQMDLWQRTGEITAWEFAVLLTALIYGADKVANTCGQYDAFLKHLGKPAYGHDGTHLVDSSAYKPLQLLTPALRPVRSGNGVYCQDANTLIGRLKPDVLYLDPPYNARQYIDNYHVLENIARWQFPALYGKTKKFPRDELKSLFSSSRQAGAALDDLLSKANTEHIFLSYNCEGLLTHEILTTVLTRHGKVQTFETKYNVFGNGAGQAKRRRVTERLYYCKK